MAVDSEIVANIEIQGDITPTVASTGNIGTPAQPFAEINANTIKAGDLHLRDDERNAHWVLREETDRIVAINKITGKRFTIALTPIEEEEEE